MAKAKSAYTCSDCGATALQWFGACPSCGAAPIMGPYWVCDLCHERFDTFEHRAVCPRCAKNFPKTICVECRQSHPMAEWLRAGALAEPPGAENGKL